MGPAQTGHPSYGTGVSQLPTWRASQLAIAGRCAVPCSEANGGSDCALRVMYDLEASRQFGTIYNQSARHLQEWLRPRAASN
eukprot:scaffold32973_cov31-Tisochrysis_lutea.AAC.6